MNWNMKDENIKNRLWLERCRKDAQAKARNHGTQSGQFVPHFNSLMKQVVTQDIQHRSQRFMDRNKPLLISMSQFISDDNDTPLAVQLRRFRKMRPNKLSDNSLNFSPNRMYREAAGSAARAVMESTKKQMELDGEDFSATSLKQKRAGGARCQTYPLRPASAGKASGEAAPATESPAATIHADPVVAASTAVAEAPHPSGTTHVAAPSLQVADVVTRPRMRPSSADYGWMPSRAASIGSAWQDPRFSHKLATTDVTRDKRI